MTIAAVNDDIQIEKLSLGVFGTNSYIVTCLHTGEAVVIDAPGEAQKVLKRLKDVHPQYILLTHNHADHTGALADLKAALQIPVGVHPSDNQNLGIEPEWLLRDNDRVEFGKVRLSVLHTPGHTPGGLCFYTNPFLLAGDTLFPNGPGKTGSPRAFRQILQSLQDKLFTLPDETHVFPGHGDSATIGRERSAFERFLAHSRDANMHGDVLWSRV